MVKFGRNYSLLIETANAGSITVKPPFTLEFDINRDYFGSANRASLRVYNLSSKNRNLIRKDVYSYDNFRQVDLQAGYGDRLSTVLRGNITHAWSFREGTNFISQIECFDSGFAFANAITQAQFPGGTPQQNIIDNLTGSLEAFKVSKGAIGNFQGSTSRGTSYSGSTTDILRELTGGGFFIDNQKAHCLNENECTDDTILVINSQSGLLGTPLLEESIVHLDVLFEPIVKVGQRVRVESLTESRFNTTYKVVGVHHRGIISEAVAGEAITTLELLSGEFTPIAQAVG